MKDLTATLIELRKHYQSIVTQSEQQAAEAKTQIAHLDALLVNGVMQSPSPTVELASPETIPLTLAPATDIESAPVTTPVITSPEVKPKEPAKAPHQPEAKTVVASQKGASLPVQTGQITLLPAYAGLNKLEAIAKVLNAQAGQVLHQDTITQLLYGDLSSDQRPESKRKMRASLFQGTTKGFWQKAPNHRSSYWVPTVSGKQLQETTETASAIPATVTPSPTKGGSERRGNQRKSKAMASSTPTKSSSRGRTQILALPTQYEGLSKIEAVAKVLQENPGQVVHIDAIIAKLYGTLSPEETAAERVRMKDVMKRGIERKLWKKAPGIPSSIVLSESRSSGSDQDKPKTTARKPKARTQSKAKTPAAKPNQTKRKQAELVALLKKGGVNV
jgi:hypothetical protein